LSYRVAENGMHIRRMQVGEWLKPSVVWVFDFVNDPWFQFFEKFKAKN
jgi:hypothetical protein